MSPTLAYAVSLYMAFGIWRQDAGVLDWLVAVVFLLTMNAAASCWDLMHEIARRGGAA